MSELKNPRAFVENLIMDFVAHSPENTLKNAAGEKAFEGPPLVGFARGDDPLFESYKEYVGPFHWTPLEAFRRVFPEAGAGPGDLTVISWILPQTKATKADNRGQERYPAERWARARIFGEEVNVKLRKLVVSALDRAGVPAVAPQLVEGWSVKKSERFTVASTWSERHAAHAAGLGTFGLCDGLITIRGKAMRTGSVVAALSIAPTPRSYRDHRAWCLFFSEGTCGKCIKRCPVGAITEKGKDKLKCLAHLRPVTEEYVKANYGFDGYGCGLCQTAVPCESGLPVS
ncbi:MAG: epoxyqueuosine reductase [Thermodesulfobacteriota bacterium]